MVATGTEPDPAPSSLTGYQEAFESLIRETSVAVDVTEQTAAKTALQMASVSIADRLVPKLATK